MVKNDAGEVDKDENRPCKSVADLIKFVLIKSAGNSEEWMADVKTYVSSYEK